MKAQRISRPTPPAPPPPPPVIAPAVLKKCRADPISSGRPQELPKHLRDSAYRAHRTVGVTQEELWERDRLGRLFRTVRLRGFRAHVCWLLRQDGLSYNEIAWACGLVEHHSSVRDKVRSHEKRLREASSATG